MIWENKLYYLFNKLLILEIAIKFLLSIFLHDFIFNNARRKFIRNIFAIISFLKLVFLLFCIYEMHLFSQYFKVAHSVVHLLLISHRLKASSLA